MTHKELVTALVKPGNKILDNLTASDCHKLHMILGLLTEVGELGDALKKYVIYHKPLDMENIKEELGDIEFYLEGLRQGLGINREQTIVNNIQKLSIRYSTLGYTDEQAIARADKSVEK